jgi:hypothetical protein
MLIQEVMKHLTTEEMDTLFSEKTLQAIKTDNQVTYCEFLPDFTYSLILSQLFKDCEIFTHRDPPQDYKTIFNTNGYNIAIDSVIYALNRFQDWCIQENWKGMIKILSDCNYSDYSVQEDWMKMIKILSDHNEKMALKIFADAVNSNLPVGDKKVISGDTDVSNTSEQICNLSNSHQDLTR